MDKADSVPRLLVLCQLFYPEMISSGQILTELCEELADMGVEIQVLCGPPTVVDRTVRVPRHMEYRGIQIKRVWGTRFPKLNLLGRIVNQFTYALSVLWSLFFDKSGRLILVLTNPPFLAWTCAFLRMFGGKRYLYLVFDVYPDTAVNLGILKGGGLVSRLWDLINRVAYRHASGIIVIGRCMRGIIEQKISPASREKISTIHIWSKIVQETSPERNPFVEQWGIKGKFVVSYSGNMGYAHDMETVMEAARILRAYEDMVFLFIGEGHKKKWMMDFTNERKMGNCQFHTYVERESLGFSMLSADVGLVSLAAGQEGLSVPSKTYGLMAAGLPVVAVVPPLSEIAMVLEEEQCGIVVGPGDVDALSEAILYLYSNPSKRETMGMNGKRAIDLKYSLRLAAEKYYRMILSHSQ